jgi:hypothetical protein
MPLATVFAMAAVGTAAILFLTPCAMAGPRAFPRLVRVVPAAYRNPGSPRVPVAPETGVRKLNEPSATAADDALDLVRLDDDGGWQLARRPPA